MPPGLSRIGHRAAAAVVALVALALPAAAPAKPQSAAPMAWTFAVDEARPAVAHGNAAYAIGSVVGVGQTLARTDGSAAGTQLVTDPAGRPVVGVLQAISSGGELYFTATGKHRGNHDPATLWKATGTSATVVTTSLPGSPWGQLAATSRGLTWSSDDTVSVLHGNTFRELYRAPGATVHVALSTPNGSAYLRAVHPRAPFGFETDLVRIAPDGRTTVLVARANDPQAVAAGNDVYYAAADAEHGTEPWVTDGTLAGTTLVADLTPGPASSGVRLKSDGNLVAAVVHSPAQTENTVMRLSRSGATPLQDPAGKTFSEIEGVWPAGSTGYWKLNAYGPTHRAAGGVLGPALGPPPISEAFGASDGALYSSYWDSPNLVRVDASGEPRVIAALEREGIPRAGGYKHPAGGFAEAGGIVYFTAMQDFVRRLWRTDGTAAGTFPLIPPTASTQLTVYDLSGDLDGGDHTVLGMIQFPANGAARCRGKVSLEIRRDGKLRLRRTAKARWTGTACRYSASVPAKTYRPRADKPNRFSASATFGRGRTAVTARTTPSSYLF